MNDARGVGRARPGDRLGAPSVDHLEALAGLLDDFPDARPPWSGGPLVASSHAAAAHPDRPPAAGGALPEGAPAPVTAGGDPATLESAPAAPLRLWWDDPRPARPLPDRERAGRADDWPRPVIPPGAPLPPYDGCRWPRACALLGRRLSSLSLLPCRCTGGEAVARAAGGVAGPG